MALCVVALVPVRFALAQEEGGTEAPAPSASASTPAPVPSTSTSTSTSTEVPFRALRYSGTIGVISLPRLLSLELLVHTHRRDDPRYDRFAFGVGVEYLPPGAASFGGTDLTWFQTGIDGMWFPWRWAFVGLRLGWQFSKADSVKFGSNVSYNTTAFVAAPRAGALFVLPSGITLGGELGADIPFGYGTTLTSDGTEDSNARKVSKTFGMFTMPFLTLFRIGYTI